MESSIREIESVVNEYDNIKYIFFEDEVLGPSNKWRKEFCAKYKERINLKFMCCLRVELASEDLMKTLKDAGCHKILFGVESGNEYIRKEVMNRKMTDDNIIKAFDLCHKHGIQTVAVNIIGVPGESKEMIWDTIKLNRRLRPTVSGVNVFYPYKGTKLGDKCFAKGIVDEKKYETFSNERRETVLRFPDVHKKMLHNIYENWQILVYPYNFKFRLRAFLTKIGILERVLKIKKMLFVCQI